MKTRPSKQRKTSQEKLRDAKPARVVAIPPRMQKQHGKGKMLIPHPLDVDAAIRKVPRGKIVTIAKIREQLARDAGADVTCPMVAGLFVRICAEAAAEQIREGKSRVTPYWRVVRDDGRLLETLPGGPSEQARHLEAEGHNIDSTARLRVLF